MVEPVAVLIPHPQVARVRKVDRRPTSRDEDKDNDKERNAKREEMLFSQNKSLGHKGTIWVGYFCLIAHESFPPNSSMHLGLLSV